MEFLIWFSKEAIMFVFLIIAFFCLLIYVSWNLGHWQGRFSGYNEAKDHYNVMLINYAKSDENWNELGSFYKNGKVDLISKDPCATEKEHQDYCDQNHLNCCEDKKLKGIKNANCKSNEESCSRSDEK